MSRIGNLFKKDVLLGIKDVWIILEVVFAVVIMLMLLFVLPEDIKRDTMIYIHDSTGIVQEFVDKFAEDFELESEMYVDSREEIIAGMQKNKSAMGLIISKGENTLYRTELLIQPYTTDAMMKYIEADMEDLLSILHPPFGAYPLDVYESVKITSLQEGLRDELPFNKRLLPPVLLMMVGIMGLFIMLAMIGQERSDATIRAFRVTPTGMWSFLLSKHLILMVVSCITFSILYIPIMGFGGYLPALLIILLTVIIGSSIGVILGTYFDNPMGSIGWVLLLMMVISLPAISLFAPIFSPDWLKFIPSYHTLFGLDAAMFPDNNSHIIWQGAGILTAVGGVLFVLSGLIFSKRIRREA
ncbi:MAG: ABC transporter permease [Candidatus Marinimicrobia bacterium]|nr:ABC transporter permease [Candidatus Neomarinimicrobiota bacterium]